MSERESVTHSAAETAKFLNEKFGPDECDRLALIACMMGKAVYEANLDEALFWNIVFVRRQRRKLNEASRRELQALLDDSRHWTS